MVNRVTRVAKTMHATSVMTQKVSTPCTLMAVGVATDANIIARKVSRRRYAGCK
jgi:hypothetical protein